MCPYSNLLALLWLRKISLPASDLALAGSTRLDLNRLFNINSLIVVVFMNNKVLPRK